MQAMDTLMEALFNTSNRANSFNDRPYVFDESAEERTESNC